MRMSQCLYVSILPKQISSIAQLGRFITRCIAMSVFQALLIVCTTFSARNTAQGIVWLSACVFPVRTHQAVPCRYFKQQRFPICPPRCFACLGHSYAHGHSRSRQPGIYRYIASFSCSRFLAFDVRRDRDLEISEKGYISVKRIINDWIFAAMAKTVKH